MANRPVVNRMGAIMCGTIDSEEGNMFHCESVRLITRSEPWAHKKIPRNILWGNRNCSYGTRPYGSTKETLHAAKSGALTRLEAHVHKVRGTYV